MMWPSCQKYWYAFMTGDPWDRKPSTSRGALPTHTVAPKLSWSDARCVLVFLTWDVLMPQDGSGTRSGSALAGGRARSGTAGLDRSGRVWARGAARGARAARAASPQHDGAFTTFTLTLADASAAGTFSSCA